MSLIKEYWSIISVGVVALLLVLRWAVTSSYPVQLINEEYDCKLSACTYKYELVNSSDQNQNGEVLVKTYRQGGIKSKVSLESVVEPYSLPANSKRVFQGKINSSEAVETLRFIHVSNQT